MKLGTEDNRRIAERAAQYLGALTEGNDEREAFFAWLAESPRHVEEFLLVLRTAQAVAGFTQEQERRLEEIGTGIEGKVVLLETNRHETPHSSPAKTARRARKRLIATAAAMTAAVGLAWWLLPGMSGWQTYTTAVGEQRTVKLADGSMVLLNTDSRLRVRFGTGERMLQLTAGEALFTAARDPARPFRVHAGDTVIEAIGTQFGVYRSTEGTRVSVLEGVVQVGTETTTAPIPPRLNAGEEARVGANGELVNRTRLDPAKAVAWRQRRLVFEDETLAAIVQEFNRYNLSPRIRVEDESAGSRRFSGTFDADAPETMLNTLHSDAALSVTRTGDEVRIRIRPPPRP